MKYIKEIKNNMGTDKRIIEVENIDQFHKLVEECEEAKKFHRQFRNMPTITLRAEDMSYFKQFL